MRSFVLASALVAFLATDASAAPSFRVTGMGTTSALNLQLRVNFGTGSQPVPGFRYDAQWVLINVQGTQAANNARLCMCWNASAPYNVLYGLRKSIIQLRTNITPPTLGAPYGAWVELKTASNTSYSPKRWAATGPIDATIKNSGGSDINAEVLDDANGGGSYAWINVKFWSKTAWVNQGVSATNPAYPPPLDADVVVITARLQGSMFTF
jgi:hypothetical protein